MAIENSESGMLSLHFHCKRLRYFINAVELFM